MRSRLTLENCARDEKLCCDIAAFGSGRSFDYPQPWIIVATLSISICLKREIVMRRSDS
jgi:hypothetical protein